MAHRILWPTAAHPAAETPASPPPTLLEALDSGGFSASLGPDLSRLFGTRISVRAPAVGQQAEMPAARMLALGQIRLVAPAGPAPIDIAIEARGAALLVERLFGNRAPGSGPDHAQAGAWLNGLPPGSGSWISLCRFVSAAISRAMAISGHGSAGAPAYPARATPSAPQHGAIHLPLILDIDGAKAGLRLSDPSTPARAPAPEPPPPPDSRLWRRRTEARALQLDLPVALRLADTRMPLSDVAALRAGDVIPLARPRSLAVLISGQRLADIPAHRLLPTDPEEPTP